MKVGTSANPLALSWSLEEGYALMMQEQMQKLDISAASRSSRRTEDEGPPYEVKDGVAILSLSGPLSKTLAWWSWYFGGTSTLDFRQALAQAAADPSVKAILLDVDSPGGTTAGTQDAADDVYALSQKMPVTAYVSDLCCSAALWIASQCSAVYAGSTSMIGSIGTVMVMTDSSRAAENAGVSVHVISTGKYKGAGARGASIAPEHLADWQRLADDINAEFIAAVARGRKMTPDAVSALADGRVHVGKAAQELGLIDGIASRESVLSTMQTSPAAERNPAAHLLTAAGARGKKESKSMNLIQRAQAYLAGLKAAGGELSDEEKQKVDAAEAALTGERQATDKAATQQENGLPYGRGAWHTLERLSEADPQLNARLEAQQKANETLIAQNADILKQLAKAETSARLERNQEAVSGLVRQMKLTPAAAEAWKALAGSNADAFEAALPALKAGPVLPQFERKRLDHVRTGASTESAVPGERLAALTAQRAKESKIPYAEAAMQVALENPELAAAHKTSAPAGGNPNA